MLNSLADKIGYICVRIASFCGWLSFVNPALVHKYISKKRELAGKYATNKRDERIRVKNAQVAILSTRFAGKSTFLASLIHSFMHDEAFNDFILSSPETPESKAFMNQFYFPERIQGRESSQGEGANDIQIRLESIREGVESDITFHRIEGEVFQPLSNFEPDLFQTFEQYDIILVLIPRPDFNQSLLLQVLTHLRALNRTKPVAIVITKWDLTGEESSKTLDSDKEDSSVFKDFVKHHLSSELKFLIEDMQVSFFYSAVVQLEENRIEVKPRGLTEIGKWIIATAKA